MRIAVVTENKFVGKVPDGFNNLRTEFGWMRMLEAEHVGYEYFLEGMKTGTILYEYDLFLFIIPKKFPNVIQFVDQFPGKKGVIQEGPLEYFQEWNATNQKNYLNLLESVDFVFVHNELDKRNLECMVQPKRVHVIPTCQYTTKYKPHPCTDNTIIINGNCTTWYNGHVAYNLAHQVGFKEYWMPTMGRRHGDEEVALQDEVQFIPYCNIDEWMHKLTYFKFALNLMPTIAAGSFALNCAMVGVPCVGFSACDTQSKLFPKLSVPAGEYWKARKLLRRLKRDKKFYAQCVDYAKKALDEFDIDKQGEKLRDYISEELLIEKI